MNPGAFPAGILFLPLFALPVAGPMVELRLVDA